MKYFQILLALVISALFLVSCEEPVLEDTDLAGGSNNLVFTDTLTILTTTVKESPLAADELPQHLLGSMDDPVVGKTLASFYTEYRLPSDSVLLPGGVTLDSIVLAFAFDGAYGDLTQPQSIVAYEIAQDIDLETDYKTDAQFTISPTEIGRLDNYIPDFESNIQVNDSLYDAHFRMKLNNTFGNKLLSYLASPVYISNTDFQALFHGIYLTIDTGNQYGSGVIYMDVDDALSRLILYYTEGGEAKSIALVTDDKTASVNHYHHNLSGSLAAQPVGSQSLSDSVVYIQSMAGLKAKIEFPHIARFKDILINKAELIVTQVNDPTGTDDTYPAPARMIINAVGDDGENDFVPDQLEDLDYFGGGRLTVTNTLGVSVSQYRFNLARHFQQLVNNEVNNNGLFLLTFPSNQIGDRVILGGRNHPIGSAKLRLTYTKIN